MRGKIDILLLVVVVVGICQDLKTMDFMLWTVQVALQHLLRIKKPTWEWQSLLHRLQL